ncbi:MAG: hypothetical protein ACJ8IR_12620 [Alphaproteobacteria bacterium]
MKISALIGTAAALVASTAMAASNPALLTHKPAHLFVTGVPPGSKTLYDQNKDDAGQAVLSQSLDGSQAADDFDVPKGHLWTIKEVDVTGIYFNGSGPADSENVFFYKDNGGFPGDLLVACPNQSGTGSGFGSFAIVLSKTCKAKLKGGKTYWVSVQANIDFNGGAGEWGWELTLDTHGNRAVWFGDGCPTGCQLDSDLMFALKGRDRLRN